MFLLSHGGEADEPQLVVIVRDAQGSPVASRVESELADLGIAVQTILIGDGASADAPLAAIGERTRAAAAIRIGADGAVEVWAAGESSTEAVVAKAAGESGDRLIAIAAAELVRARLLGAVREAPARGEPGEATPPAPTGETARPAPPAIVATNAAEARRRERITAEIGPAVLASGLDLNPTVNVFLALAVRIAKPLSIELFGATPLVPTRAEADAGTARMHTALAGGGLRLGLETRSGRLSFLAAPGIAALVLVLDGRAADGYEARSETVATAAPLLRLAASIRLAPRLRIGLDAIGGVALSEVAVRIGGRDAARVGRPILGAALCLEVILW